MRNEVLRVVGLNSKLAFALVAREAKNARVFSREVHLQVRTMYGRKVTKLTVVLRSLVVHLDLVPLHVALVFKFFQANVALKRVQVAVLQHVLVVLESLSVEADFTNIARHLLSLLSPGGGVPSLVDV